MVIVSPVGPYFKGGIKPLNLKVNTDYHRAAPKGIGNAKAIGNYSASLFSLMEAKAEGFDENIYLDAKDENFVDSIHFTPIGMKKLAQNFGDTILEIKE